MSNRVERQQRRTEAQDAGAPPPRSGVRAAAHLGGPEARIGDRVAERYELTRLLGRGAGGIVYEARVAHGGRVAVKLLHAHLRASDGHVARFSREVLATCAIAHPSVVRVLDAGEDRDGTLFLVTELLEGELLFDRIARRLSTRQILLIGRQLLGALAAAHEAGIVHRDIKPENLFLVRTFARIQLKVLDFGIAKLVRPQPGYAYQTRSGVILGTPAYLSPELCRGQPATEAADLWAAATVLYEAFTGAPPFDEPNVGRLLIEIANGRAPSLRIKRPDLPGSVITAIDRALDPDPAERWPSAQDFARALR